MKLFTAGLLILTLFLSVSFSETISEEEKLAWKADRKLGWNDFKGVPNGADSFVASTNSGISFSFSYEEKNGVGSVDYTIISNFYPGLSWYRPNKVSTYILEHEQLHFDITELHARKLRKRLAPLEENRGFRDKAEVIYNNIEKERREMQYKYDGESDHSNVKEAEYRWRKFVEKELNTYKAWQ